MKRVHSSDCGWHYGHDCDCGQKEYYHSDNCGWKYGHDCDCGYQKGKK